VGILRTDDAVSGCTIQNMHLSDFRDLIANMPTAYHATTSKRSTWNGIFALQNPAAAALDSIFQEFGGPDEVDRLCSALCSTESEPPWSTASPIKGTYG
jgi:hypothetical protein